MVEGHIELTFHDPPDAIIPLHIRFGQARDCLNDRWELVDMTGQLYSNKVVVKAKVICKEDI